MPVGDRSPVVPDMDISHDEEKYTIRVKLPRVSKEDIDLGITEHSMCLSAPREDVELSACQSLAHPVDPSGASAKFKDEILEIELPLAESSEGEEVEIQ